VNIFLLYLRAAATIGFKSYAKRLADKWWATPSIGKKKDAAALDFYTRHPQSDPDDAEIEDLQRRSGLFDKEAGNEQVELYGYDWRLPWEKQPDGASALAALPDRQWHRMFEPSECL
jgi:hypothetical protein